VIVTGAISLPSVNLNFVFLRTDSYTLFSHPHFLTHCICSFAKDYYFLKSNKKITYVFLTISQSKDDLKQCF